MATQPEIEKLKQDWQRDPIWDIEETDGFEEHRQDLLAFRLKLEDHWEQLRKRAIRDKALKLHALDKEKLVEYCMGLERRIEKVEGLLAL